MTSERRPSSGTSIASLPVSAGERPALALQLDLFAPVPVPSATLARWRCEGCGVHAPDATPGPRVLLGEPQRCASTCWWCRGCGAELWALHLRSLQGLVERRERIRRWQAGELWARPNLSGRPLSEFGMGERLRRAA